MTDIEAKLDINENIKRKGPVLMELAKGQKIAWCACGYSADQMLCSSAHREYSTLRPVVFESDADKKVALCGCKRTGTPPFCDGTHSRL